MEEEQIQVRGNAGLEHLGPYTRGIVLATTPSDFDSLLTKSRTLGERIVWPTRSADRTIDCASRLRFHIEVFLLIPLRFRAGTDRWADS
ncbi:hypothetical protein Y032_0119g827 [Ancylostoma ceylanicum]|uniref:Uncharacterized protein n=1 Tax=Ancylostoma ceylanicum TaxID=53326 RepID=A0A016TB63_9BILA|nr:hypothetical protein Y032_0119g827 [Ancylostoma ceylanicum]